MGKMGRGRVHVNFLQLVLLALTLTASVLSTSTTEAVSSGDTSQAIVINVNITNGGIGIPTRAQTVFVGDHVRLVCAINGAKGHFLWAKDGSSLHDPSKYPNYNMTDGNLTIARVNIQDEGMFSCQFEAGTDGSYTPWYDVSFAVEIIPDPPVILQGGQVDAVAVDGENVTLRLTCESLHGRPPPEIIWLDTQGDVVTEGVVTEHYSRYSNVTINQNSTTNSVLSFYTFKVMKEHNAKNVSCQVHPSNQRAGRRLPEKLKTASVQLNISFAPEVHMAVKQLGNPESQSQYYIIPPDELYHPRCSPLILRVPLYAVWENGDVKIVCRGSANPPLVFRWSVNGKSVDVMMKELEQEYELTTSGVDVLTALVLRNVTRRLHRSVFKCEGENAFGTTSAYRTLEVHSPIIAGPAKNSVEEVVKPGAVISWTCETDTSSSSEIEWTYSNTFGSPPKVVSRSPTYNFTVHEIKVGTYECRDIESGLSATFQLPACWLADADYSSTWLHITIGLAAVDLAIIGMITVIFCYGTSRSQPRSQNMPSTSTDVDRDLAAKEMLSDSDVVKMMGESALPGQSQSQFQNDDLSSILSTYEEDCDSIPQNFGLGSTDVWTVGSISRTPRQYSHFYSSSTLPRYNSDYRRKLEERDDLVRFATCTRSTRV